MTFVNPWILLLGALAATLPVLIHWLTRPRPIVLPLSTVRFVQQAVQERRARRRLRDYLILAARIAAVLLLAGAMARPLLGRRPPPAADAQALATRVVVLDVSQSMAARTGGVQSIERARPVAATQFAFQPGLAVNLLLCGATVRSVFDRPSTNFGALREDLGKAAALPERLSAQAALNAAAAMVSAEGGKGAQQRREVVIVSDFQRTQWATADFSVFPRDTQIVLESVAPAETPSNIAVLGVACSGRAEVGRPLAIQIDVGNFSTAARPVELELTIESATYHLTGLCSAGGKTSLSTEIVPRAAGWQAGRAKLVGTSDALVEDDSRPFVLDVRQPPVFALITRESAAVRPGSSYYLERALLPAAAAAGGAPDRPGARVVRFDPERDDREALAAADLFVLDHPGRLPEPLAAALASSLRRGRSIFYVACEPADAANLKRLRELAGTDLRPPVEFAPMPEGGSRGPRFIADFRRDSPPLEVFGDALATTFAPLRFSGALASHPLPDALADDIRAVYSDRSACLVISSCGAGYMAILNADLGASDLPTSPAFVPLVGELTTLLLGRRSIETPVACGEPFALPLPLGAGPPAELTVVEDRETAGASGGETAPAEVVDEPQGPLCRARAAPGPAVIRVKRRDQTVFALATAISETESDLAALPASVFRNRLAGDRALSYHDATEADESSDSFWTWLALGCAVGLVMELLLLRIFKT
jgi:hypothetical protein